MVSAAGWLDQPLDISGKTILVLGGTGMVGAAILRRLKNEDVHILSPNRSALNLLRQDDVEVYMRAHKPDIVIMAAGKVGGIVANVEKPAAFLYENLMIEANVIHSCYLAGVEKLLFLGSSCIYPKDAAIPIVEDALLSGALEPTNAPYALAKIAGVKMCDSYRMQFACDYISAMPCNLYGIGDRYDARKSHVVPALLMRAHMAKVANDPELIVWGSGQVLREFLFVDDLADGLIFLLKNYSGAGAINIGSGEEISVAELASLICETVGFEGRLVFDKNMPDGVKRKLIDSQKIMNAGWRYKTTLRYGLAKTYEDFLAHH
ncbi:MAG: GDP-fucose synthetase [Micavibrio sp.]|nr:GDP-fucose synthetase [Micavibrio sp.]